ncbi:hypothetical protein M9H77_23206 [Catharanthus roseus]|uniref:Uncharacterized protein n=1 Tax=Catharanthus roseus TaxID=4058 RepID=A0ACC0ASC5_CATRO|nr:hypothetical protein M9H77_23206 [Catharanthus roseus]
MGQFVPRGTLIPYSAAVNLVEVLGVLHNCYKDGDYGGNAYRGSHHIDGHFTHRIKWVLNQVLTRDATLEQSCFDLKCWHDILHVVFMVFDSFPTWAPMWGMIPIFLDSFVGKFLVKKVEEYLCSLIGDLFDKSMKRIVEAYSYMISSFETYIIAFNGIAHFQNHFLNVKIQLEDPCDDHKILIGLKFLMLS